MQIAVAGTGYVGLVTAVYLAQHEHNVICVDLDAERVELMQRHIAPIYEPGLEELMIKNRHRLEYTTDYKMAYKNAEVILIVLGTPEKEEESANLNYIFSVTKQIAESVEEDCIIGVKLLYP